MDRQSVRELVRDVMGPNTEMIDTTNWVSIPCPLAPWTHEKRRDSNPSAGISVKESGASIFNCFTCHRRGPVPWLLRLLSDKTGENYSGMADSIEAGEFFGGHIPEWGEMRGEDSLPEPINKQEYFDLYDSAVGHPYLAKRGISRWAARECELLFDPGDGGEPRILFPVYGYDKKLYGFSGRAIRSTAKLKVKDYFGLPKKRLLLGSHLLRGDERYVILVEGIVDYARMVTMGYPGMAFMSSTLTEWQAEILKEIGKPVYFFHDDDKAGKEARDNAKELLWRHIPVMKVRYPTDCTVETPEGDFRPPEDPAELTAEQVEEMIEDARLL